MLGDLLRAHATLALLGILVGVQLVLASLGGVVEIPEAYERLGLSRAGMRAGWLWQPFSYGWIHGNWAHLWMNVGGLLAFGPPLERIGGPRLVLKVMAGGLLLGGAFHLCLGGGGLEALPLVGASGGIFALLLWLTGVSPGSQMWPLKVSGRSLGQGMLLASAALVLLNPALGLPGLSKWGAVADGYCDGLLFQISHACHFGGALAGWLGARWALRPRVSLARLQRERARRTASELRGESGD